MTVAMGRWASTRLSIGMFVARPPHSVITGKWSRTSSRDAMGVTVSATFQQK